MASVATQNSNGLAPAGKVSLSPSTAGIFHVPQITPESAKTASELLQENHIKNHVFFNQSGFHNHIAHHLLTIYSLGASPSQLQVGFRNNQSYQRAQGAIESDVLKDMKSSRDKIPTYFGKEKHFRVFEEFFEREIEATSVKDVLKNWVFKGDEVAEGLLTRLFAGFYHPLIHLGFALEFHQPSILTEALAQAAVHDNWVAPYLHSCEEKAAATTTTSSTKQKSLIDLLHEVKSNTTIRNSPKESDGNKTRDGVIGRAADPMIQIASQFTVQPNLEDLRLKAAEMIQTAFYFTAGAQNPRKIPKFDFFYMHCTNASIFYSAFLEDPKNLELFGVTIATGDKEGEGEGGEESQAGLKNLARLVEMKARVDLAMYPSRNSPELYMDRIKEYKPKHPDQGWSELFARACRYEDDGHASKLVRATANAERVCRPYEESRGWPVRGEMWLKIGHMVVDSVEAEGPTWVRGAGWEKEWSDVPDLEGVGKL